MNQKVLLFLDEDVWKRTLGWLEWAKTAAKHLHKVEAYHDISNLQDSLIFETQKGRVKEVKR